MATRSATESAARRAFYRLRRVAYRAYYGLARLNYEREVLATRKRTAAGAIRTYDPLNRHGRDAALACLAEAADPGDIVVDAGANVGVYALGLASDPGCRVAAFEPAPATFRRLRANLAATDTDDRVSAHRIGLSDEDGTATFYRSSYPELSSFERGNASRWEAEAREAVEVPVRRLDGLVADGTVPPPDFLKVDVEGHALPLLRGARETLTRHRPAAVVEVHPVSGGDEGRDRGANGREDAVRALFRDCGYAVEADGDVWVCRHDAEI